jgi:hypothetical protein
MCEVVWKPPLDNHADLVNKTFDERSLLFRASFSGPCVLLNLPVIYQKQGAGENCIAVLYSSPNIIWMIKSRRMDRQGRACVVNYWVNHFH